ncbi:MAG: hypothetical protein ACLFM0_04280 [Spirochaetales bacterium]
MDQMLIDSSNVTLPTLGAANTGAGGGASEIESQAAAEAAEETRTAEADRAEADRAEESAVRDDELGRTVDVLA